MGGMIFYKTIFNQDYGNLIRLRKYLWNALVGCAPQKCLIFYRIQQVNPANPDLLIGFVIQLSGFSHQFCNEF